MAVSIMAIRDVDIDVSFKIKKTTKKPSLIKCVVIDDEETIQLGDYNIYKEEFLYIADRIREEKP